METGKLLKIIEDIQADESNFNFQQKFQNILNFYNENNSEKVNEEKKVLAEDISKSLLSDYVMTDYKVLENLDIVNFFGTESEKTINLILSSQVHEVRGKLESFINQRKESLTKLDQIKISLTAVKLQPLRLVGNQYEIAFSFPAQYTDIASFEDVLGDIRNFLTALANAIDADKNFVIKYVNNGSIEIYINATFELAKYFNDGLKYTLEYYSAIKVYGEIREKYEKFNQNSKKVMEKANREELETNRKKIIDEFVSLMNIQDPEKQTSVKQLFTKMLKHLEKGLSAEVRTPTMEVPQKSADESEDSKRQYEEKNKQYQTKKEIEKQNKEIFILQQNNFYGMNSQFLDLVDQEENDGKQDQENKKQ